MATTPAPLSPQVPSPAIDALLFPIEGEIDEHCQALSITIPADASPDDWLPVMVFVHGGSYVIGGGDLVMNDPYDLVTEQRVIVVLVTYRLGLLGFLGDGENVPANLGLLDLVAALRWVRENIASFGGDPDSVTAFGQSAGADAIAHLMVSDGATGLFRRAIIQSAPLGLSHRRGRMTRAMLREIGSLDADTPIVEVLERQRRAEKVAAPFGLRGGMPFGTQYGQAPLPAERDVHDAWRRAAPHYDVLIGWCCDEAGMLVPLLPPLKRAVRNRVARALVRWWLVRPLTELIYGRAARAFAARHRRSGGNATVYRLLHGATSTPTGAVHMSDLPLLLGRKQAWAGSRLVTSDAWPEAERRGPGVRAIWAEFARTGRVTAPDDQNLVFDRR